MFKMNLQIEVCIINLKGIGSHIILTRIKIILQRLHNFRVVRHVGTYSGSRLGTKYYVYACTGVDDLLTSKMAKEQRAGGNKFVRYKTIFIENI